jgi:hypothetical protein
MGIGTSMGWIGWLPMRAVEDRTLLGIKNSRPRRCRKTDIVPRMEAHLPNALLRFRFNSVQLLRFGCRAKPLPWPAKWRS